MVCLILATVLMLEVRALKKRNKKLEKINIGLATVRRIVRRRGGAIDTRNREDEGSTLTFSL